MLEIIKEFFVTLQPKVYFTTEVAKDKLKKVFEGQSKKIVPNFTTVFSPSFFICFSWNGFFSD